MIKYISMKKKINRGINKYLASLTQKNLKSKNINYQEQKE